jgi:acetylcholinesterase
MRGIWAKFAKNPMGGPGWNGVGTGAAGPVLTGAIDVVEGGVYMDASGDVLTGAWDLGLFGNRYDAMGSGVTVIDQFDVDYRCGLFTALYG